jgi:UDP-N-acetylmuramoyl-L-alanyl-D-glutamate--2,6-diaminopimelate ligase
MSKDVRKDARTDARTDLCTDSRLVQAGDAFIAWPGGTVDGRQFMAAALAQGAVACLAEADGIEPFAHDHAAIAAYAGLKVDAGAIAAEYYDHPSRNVDVVAITGTNGKTSTSWWLAQALCNLPGVLARNCGVIGTLGVGMPPDVVHTGLTTPDPIMVQRTLAEFLRHGVRACAMEASSIGIAEHRMVGCNIQVAVFTNFTQDHLDYHATMQEYWQAKRALFAWHGLRSAVINVDDAQGAALAEELAGTALDVWTTACQSKARLYARAITYTRHGLRFDVVEGSEVVTLDTQVIGNYNVANLLGVIGAMRALGVPFQAAVQACSNLLPVPGRMECIGGVDQPLVAVDYAHTPDALQHVLAALRPIAQQRGGRLICVFGCGGDRDASKRAPMGAQAAQGADAVIITSDNPRSESPTAIIAQVLQGVPATHADRVNVIEDRAQAIAHAVEQAQPSDVVVLAGKGHETTQEIARQKVAFSDIAHAQSALQNYFTRAGAMR